MNIASMIDKQRANYKTKTICTNMIINKPVWALDFVVKGGTRASGVQISRNNKCIYACDLINEPFDYFACSTNKTTVNCITSKSDLIKP